MQAESNVVEFPVKEKKEVRLSLVPSQDIHKYWDLVVPGLEEALSKSGGEFTADTLLAGLQAGVSWLWIGLSGTEYGGVMITEVIQTDTRKWINIPFAYSVPSSDRSSSDLSLTFDALKQIEVFAKSMGFSGIKFLSARKGFERLAPKAGYTPRFVEYVKEF